MADGKNRVGVDELQAARVDGQMCVDGSPDVPRKGRRVDEPFLSLAG